MSELIEFPAPTATIYEFLDTALQATDFAGVHAYGLIPTSRPASFVRVRLGGGSQVDLVTSQPTVFVECYGATYQGAEALSHMCHALMMRAGRDGWFGTHPTRGVEVISLPQELPDPLIDAPRFTATYAPMLRGTAA